MDIFVHKNCTTSFPIPESNRTCMSEVFFFHKLLFGWLSDLEVGTESYLPVTALIISKLYFFPITTMKHKHVSSCVA